MRLGLRISLDLLREEFIGLYRRQRAFLYTPAFVKLTPALSLDVVVMVITRPSFETTRRLVATTSRLFM